MTVKDTIVASLNDPNHSRANLDYIWKSHGRQSRPSGYGSCLPILKLRFMARFFKKENIVKNQKAYINNMSHSRPNYTKILTAYLVIFTNIMLKFQVDRVKTDSDKVRHVAPGCCLIECLSLHYRTDQNDELR